jgi:hypothetical protein
MNEPSQAELIALWRVCQNFIHDRHVSCPEACYNDRVYEYAPDLVEDIANIVGYYEYPEDES